jgi:hypothetical protein
MPCRFRSFRPSFGGFVVIAACLLLACTARHVPDPRLTVQRYAEAIDAGDGRTLYRLLDDEGRRILTLPEVEALLQQSQPELLRRARALADDAARVDVEAVVHFPNGDSTTLSVEDGRFKILGAAALPVGARSPQQALLELRAVVQRRSYGGLVRLLSSGSREALEDQMNSLVRALEDPDALDIVTEETRASVTTPEGHRIELEQEDGVWKVRDFE